MSGMRRREFLGLSVLAGGGAFLTSRLALGDVSARNSRFVLVILRGALDGLAAVPPYGDPRLRQPARRGGAARTGRRRRRAAARRLLRAASRP